jgi:hypothetical protein
LLDALMQALDAHVGAAESFDDVTTVAVHRLQQQPAHHAA